MLKGRYCVPGAELRPITQVDLSKLGKSPPNVGSHLVTCITDAIVHLQLSMVQFQGHNSLK